MENDLIRRSEAIDAFQTVEYPWKVSVRRILKQVPAVDAVEVRHGRWLATDAYPHNVYCSECYKIYVQEHWQVWQDKPGDGGIERDYCPHCGARMDGRREDGDA